MNTNSLKSLILSFRLPQQSERPAHSHRTSPSPGSSGPRPRPSGIERRQKEARSKELGTPRHLTATWSDAQASLVAPVRHDDKTGEPLPPVRELAEAWPLDTGSIWRVRRAYLLDAGNRQRVNRVLHLRRGPWQRRWHTLPLLCPTMQRRSYRAAEPRLHPRSSSSPLRKRVGSDREATFCRVSDLDLPSTFKNEVLPRRSLLPFCST